MPTALQLGPERWQPYLTHRRRRQQPQCDMDGCDALLREVRIAAERIKSELGAKRVILIGSLAHGMWWDQESDVDLVVDGLSSEGYWEAWAIAEKAIHGRRVEVIDLESVTPHMRETVEEEGLPL